MGKSSDNRSPVTPKYSSQENYIENLNGSSFGNNVFLHFLKVIGATPVEVEGDDPSGIVVEETVQSTKIKYKVKYTPYVAPVVSITSLSPGGIQLLVNAVTSVTIEYSFNKAVQSQKLYIDDVETSFTPDNLGNNQYSATVDNLNLVDDTIFKIEASDGINTASATRELRFGDYFYHGKTTVNWSAVPGDFLTNNIPDADTDKVIVDENSAISFTCKSGSGEKDWVALPLGVIEKASPKFKDRENILPGGYNTIGTINIPNGSAGDPSNLYTVYVSINWNIGGAIFDVT